MIQKLPFCLIVVLFSHLQVAISKSDLHARTSLNISPNGSTFLWLPQDEYSGPSFFECVDFLFRDVKHLRITGKPLGLFHGRRPNTVRKSLRYLSGMLISCDSGTVKWVFHFAHLMPRLWCPYYSYTTKTDALATGLAFVTSQGKVMMQGDNTTWLDEGVSRRRYASIIPFHPRRSEWACSVRISSNAQYNGGLFILDLDKAPWGCGKVK